MTEYTFSIRIDTSRNVMYMTQCGRPDAAGFRRLKEEFIHQAERLDRSFFIVNDQRTLEPFDDEAMEIASELVRAADSCGVPAVIRILPADLVSKTKVSRSLVVGASHYRTIRVATPDEAEMALNDLMEGG